MLVIMTAVYAASRGPARGGVPAAIGREEAPATPAITGGCKTPRSDFATQEATGASTTSTSYVDVPGMSVAIHIGGTSPTCVTVNFTAFAYAPGTALEWVRAVLNRG